MVNIEYVKDITREADVVLLEMQIDEEILEKARQGFSSCTFLTRSETKLTAYKDILEKYTGFEVSYGKNHDGLHVVKVSWADI